MVKGRSVVSQPLFCSLSLASISRSTSLRWHVVEAEFLAVAIEDEITSLRIQVVISGQTSSLNQSLLGPAIGLLMYPGCSKPGGVPSCRSGKVTSCLRNTSSSRSLIAQVLQVIENYERN